MWPDRWDRLLPELWEGDLTGRWMACTYGSEELEYGKSMESRMKYQWVIKGVVWTKVLVNPMNFLIKTRREGVAEGSWVHVGEGRVRGRESEGQRALLSGENNEVTMLVSCISLWMMQPFFFRRASRADDLWLSLAELFFFFILNLYLTSLLG